MYLPIYTIWCYSTSVESEGRVYFKQRKHNVCVCYIRYGVIFKKKYQLRKNHSIMYRFSDMILWENFTLTIKCTSSSSGGYLIFMNGLIFCPWHFSIAQYALMLRGYMMGAKCPSLVFLRVHVFLGGSRVTVRFHSSASDDYVEKDNRQ